MNCERFQTVVNDLAREQNRGSQPGLPAMDANERAQALTHIAECDSCALIWEDERNLTAGLQNLAGEMKSLAAPSRVEERVLAAFRERVNTKPSARAVVRPFRPQRQLPRYWLAAIAAALLIVFGLVAVRSGIVSRSKPQIAKDETPKTKAPSNGQTDVINQSPPAKDKIELPVQAPQRNQGYLATSRQSKGGRVRYGSVTASLTSISDGNNEGNNEIATAFFPVSYGSTPNLREGGQLLRVELPRAAVARFGLPVNMDGTSERVKADVLVGADGLAQAIRFIH